MAFKINISEKSGKTYKLEAEAEGLIDKELEDVVLGNEIFEDLEGYELKITGTSDKSGFTSLKSVSGIGLKRVLLSYEKGMKKKPKKEGKKEYSNSNPKGLRLRKTIRGRVISDAIRQINMIVVKQGKKSLEEIFNPKVEEVSVETQ
jgi:small subunit ribosomal protein S6e